MPNIISKMPLYFGENEHPCETYEVLNPVLRTLRVEEGSNSDSIACGGYGTKHFSVYHFMEL